MAASVCRSARRCGASRPITRCSPSRISHRSPRAHHHILVSKGARGGVTTADVAVLDGDLRITELARMLGGDPESDVSRAHARELLDTAAALATDAPLSLTARGARRARK